MGRGQVCLCVSVWVSLWLSMWVSRLARIGVVLCRAGVRGKEGPAVVSPFGARACMLTNSAGGCAHTPAWYTQARAYM